MLKQRVVDKYVVDMFVKELRENIAADLGFEVLMLTLLNCLQHAQYLAGLGLQELHEHMGPLVLLGYDFLKVALVDRR